MRIGYLVNQYPMPSQTFIGREIRALEEAGDEVVRFALRSWNGVLVDDRDITEHANTRYVAEIGLLRLMLAIPLALLRNVGGFANAVRVSIRVAMCSDRSFARHLVYFAEACVLARWLQQAAIEHLHVHFASNATEVAMLAHLLGGPPYSFMVHGPEEFDRAACLSLADKAHYASFVATISSYARSQLYRWIRFEDWHKVTIVRCGLDEAYIAAAPTASPNNRRLICVGRLCEQKGQLLLVEAVAKVRAESGPFELLLIGDGELRPELEVAIVRLKLQDTVKVLGWANQAQVRQHLEESIGLVLASFAEGLPVVIMESLALSRPVISTWIAGIPELVSNGESGWLVPAGDAEALADAITQFLGTQPEVLDRMGRNGRLAVLRNHDVNLEVGALRARFRELSSERSSCFCVCHGAL